MYSWFGVWSLFFPYDLFSLGPFICLLALSLSVMLDSLGFGVIFCCLFTSGLGVKQLDGNLK